MSQKTFKDQYRKLYEIKNWVADKLAEESDKSVRDALFGAGSGIGLSLLYLEEVEYRTDGAYNND